MNAQKVFSFPSIDELIERFESDELFSSAIASAFSSDGFTSEQLREVLAMAYSDLDEPVLHQLSVALDEPMSISGITIPALPMQVIMVAAFCQGQDLVVRYKMGSGGFFDLVRTKDSTACILPLVEEGGE